MIEFTEKIVRKWPIGPEMFERKNPLPFPGNYPTRWMITGEYWGKGDKQRNPIFYLGKPNGHVAGWIQGLGLSVKLDGRIFFWEFDRGGPIKYGNRAIRFSKPTCEWANHTLCPLYYFINGDIGSMFQRWETRGMWEARTILEWDGHRVVAYDSGTIWDSSQRRMAGQWLRSTKFEWKR